MAEEKTKSKASKVSAMKTIELTNKDFLNKFFPAFTELSSLPSNKNTGRLKYAIKRSLGSVQEKAEGYNKARQLIFEDRCKMDEGGNPLFDKDKNYTFESKDLRKEAFAELDKLDNKTVSLTIYPVRKENIVSGNSALSLIMELNLGEFIIPSEEEMELLAQFEKEEA
jgi:hypothetical protein